MVDNLFKQALLQMLGVLHLSAIPADHFVFSLLGKAAQSLAMVPVSLTKMKQPIVFLNHWPAGSFPMCQCILSTLLYHLPRDQASLRRLQKLNKVCQTNKCLCFNFAMVFAHFRQEMADDGQQGKKFWSCRHKPARFFVSFNCLVSNRAVKLKPLHWEGSIQQDRYPKKCSPQASTFKHFH